MYKLYWYQEEAIQALFDFFNDPTQFLPDDFPGNPHLANPVLALPTGSGKSIIIAEFSRIVLNYWPNQRIIMLTHVKELIEQNARKLWEQWPQAPLGIFSAGLKTKEAHHPIVFGGIQSAAKAIEKDEHVFGHRDLVIIDEAHLLSPKDTSRYQVVIKKLKETNPYLRIIGLTATPYRLRHGMITDGDGLFDALAYDLCSMENFNKLILEGKLAPLIPRRTDTQLDLSSVRVVAGEYNLTELGLVSNQDHITDAAIRETLVLGADRKSWLVFASSIEHSENIAECLNYYGIPAAASHSKLSSEENNVRIKMFKRGELRALVNNNKFTTGFDHPPVDLIVMLRATLSPGLWVQMLGRGTRPSPGKENCLVLDFAGNTSRLGPINDPTVPGKPRKGAPGEAPVKTCPECACYNHLSVKYCNICGHEFAIESKLTKTASDGELLRGFTTTEPSVSATDIPQMTLETHQVSHVLYDTHLSSKVGAKPTLKVTYVTPSGRRFSEWICFSHIGFMRQKAVGWWLKRAVGGLPIPADTTEAWQNANNLSVPKTIQVSLGGRFPEIVGASM